MNRRDTLKAVLAAPFVSKIKELLPATSGQGGGTSIPTGAYPPSYEQTSRNPMAVAPTPPKIPRESALTRLLLDNNTITELRSRLFAETHPSAIDPDLMVLKSLSPMAKLAYQRQREVERKLKELANPDLNFPKQWTLAGAWLEERIGKMMWG
jgi:hypothetical protein